MFPPKLGHDGIQLGLGLPGLNTGFQPPNSLNVMRATPRWIALKRERPPHIDAVAKGDSVIAVAGVRRAWRHDSDHRIRHPIQGDLPAQNSRISVESRTPHSVAQDDLLLIAWNLGLCIELPSQLRFQTQRVEVAGCYSKAGEPLRIARSRELRIGMRIRRQRFKGGVAHTVIVKIPGIQRELREDMVGEKDPHQTVRLWEGKRLQ